MLMVSPEAPWPATTGGLVRIAALLNQMARFFDVTFVSPRWPDQTLPDDPGIRVLCPERPRPGIVRKARALLDPWRPFHVSLYSHREVGRLIRRELARQPYDVVFGHFIYCLDYLAGTGARVVIDQQNVDRMYWRNRTENSSFPVNLFARWNTRRTIAYEDRRLSRIWGYISVSDEDRQLTRAYAEQYVRHFWVAPNGVDTRRFKPAGDARRTAGRVTLGYLGSMDLEMNIDAVQGFCDTVLPAIRRALPAFDVRFVVIGRSPSPAIRQLADRTPGMSMSGTVDDVVPWLQELDILVCPLRIGAGTKLKVAEALSCGLPVVGSSLAFAGLPGRSGEHYIQADGDDCFVTAVCQLARASNERAAMGRMARELAEKHLDWEAIVRHLVDQFQEALSDPLPR
jgi:polysaccharide biosynthesis protein PslH